MVRTILPRRKENTMIEYRSNSPKGDEFILGMLSIEREMNKMQELFTNFIICQGFSAWHIHNGWVSHKGKNGSEILNEKTLTITWLESQSGYCHSKKCPDIGDEIVIIKNSPGIRNLGPFKIYCYKVVNKQNYTPFKDIQIELTGIKKALFNKEQCNYKLQTKNSPGIFSFLKRIMNRWSAKQ